MEGRANFSTLGIISIAMLFSVSAFGQDSIVPEWVKNNAEWWSAGTISESEYVSSLQYLIQQKIINIPVKQVIATDTPVDSDSFAHSFVVRVFIDGDEHKFYSFSRIIEFGEKVDFTVPRLQLEAIPSMDKKPLYEHAEKIFAKNTNIDDLDVDVDIISEDGFLIVTLQYKNCELSNYWIYTNDFKEEYRYGKQDKPELRDVFDFKCGDYRIEV